MNFRKILALMTVILLGIFILQAFLISPEKGEIALNNFGKADIENRTAQLYIDKSVNSPNEEVIYKESKDKESGSANIVTSIVANYRALDTLGEVTVLFLAATGLSAILYNKKHAKNNFVVKEGSFILKNGIKILFPLLILAGSYIIIYGHLSPGGSFQGGAVIATALLLKLLSSKEYELDENKLKAIEVTAGVSFVSIGLYGLYAEGSFLTNFLETGTIANLFSGGIVPILYITIGLKVAVELTNIINDLMKA